MKEPFLNLLTAIVFMATVVIFFLFLAIFSNPYSFLNPLPPPELPAVLVLPTATATPRSLPDIVTPNEFVSEPTQEGPTSTPRPSSTPLPTSTSFVLPTSTITPTPTATETETPTVTPTSSALSCEIVSSYPSYDQSFSPGGDFDGRWTLRNTGTDTWTDIVDLVYISGATFQTRADAVDMVKSSVAPGESTDVIVDMAAPREPGTYKAIWRLRRSGTTFCEVTIQIVVK